MADAAPGGPCEQCDGTGLWSGGCDLPEDCWQCHGTGVQRARGNCEWCIGWGMTLGAHRCERCDATGWVDEPVALYWCGSCLRTRAAAIDAPVCRHDATHAIERVTADERPR